MGTYFSGLIKNVWMLLLFTAALFCKAQESLLPMARDQEIFVGSAYSSSQSVVFEQYWNQVTPENAGKWGSVEAVRDQYNWTALDEAYQFAKDHGFIFKLHVLFWGNQQPLWIESLQPEDQLEEIIEWLDTLAARYPEMDYIEVVNEPINDPPHGTSNGNYMQALGGTGTTGYDWIIKAFELARARFPGAQLMINEYNIVNSPARAGKYKEIIELLQEKELIDGIGVQAHAFSTTVDVTILKSTLNLLAETGLPIMVTELDIDGPTDAKQLEEYQRIFPVFWNHPSITGITLWGYRPGLWRNEQKAYILNVNNSPRPVMTWLRSFVEAGRDVYPLLGLHGNKKAQVSIYPNPAKGNHLTVHASESIQSVQLYDLIGNEIFSADGSGQNELVISIQANPGIYLLQINCLTGRAHKRVVLP